MYYVIQRVRGNPTKHYIAYTVSRYITSASSENVIMEFKKEPTPKRKWAPKDVIILITANKELFQTTLQQLERIQSAHLEKIHSIKTQLDNELESMVNELQAEFSKIKQESDV